MYHRQVYLDHNATTPLRPEVLQAMLPYLQEKWGNASSLHGPGMTARAGVEEAREQVAAAINAQPEEIVFLGSGTESDNLAIKGVVAAYRGRKRPHIVTSTIEHEAVLKTCLDLQSSGTRVTFVPVDDHGRVCPDDVEEALRPETILVSLMHANNEVGTIQPIEEVARLLHSRGVAFHTDAVQTFGKLPLDVERLGVTLLSLSAHKIYGPKGVGALYVRRGCELAPQTHGGSQEGGLRAGTHNVAGAVGLGEAARLAIRDMVRDGTRVSALAERLQTRLHERVPDLRVLGHPIERLPGTLSLAVPGIRGRALVLAMNIEGIAISQGAACSSGESRISHVLAAMKLPPDVAANTVRLSLGRSNGDEDIDYVLERLDQALEAARTYSAALYEGLETPRPPDCYSAIV